MARRDRCFSATPCNAERTPSSNFDTFFFEGSKSDCGMRIQPYNILTGDRLCVTLRYLAARNKSPKLRESLFNSLEDLSTFSVPFLVSQA
jgi:hypothetical protein